MQPLSNRADISFLSPFSLFAFCKWHLRTGTGWVYYPASFDVSGLIIHLYSLLKSLIVERFANRIVWFFPFSPHWLKFFHQGPSGFAHFYLPPESLFCCPCHHGCGHLQLTHMATLWKKKKNWFFSLQKHHLPTASQLRAGLTSPPTLCWNVDWLHLTQVLCRQPRLLATVRSWVQGHVLSRGDTVWLWSCLTLVIFPPSVSGGPWALREGLWYIYMSFGWAQCRHLISAL